MGYKISAPEALSYLAVTVSVTATSHARCCVVDLVTSQLPHRGPHSRTHSRVLMQLDDGLDLHWHA